MPTITDVANRVLAAGVPVLFLDTCSILDVIRAPVRNLVGCVEAATELIGMCSNAPMRCSLVVGSFVPSEWLDHDQDTLSELERHLRQMQERAEHFHGLCEHLGIALAFGRPLYKANGFANHLHQVSRQFLRAAAVIDSDPAIIPLAYNRVVSTKRRPCKQGGELKDCTIFEECLEVCRRLRAGNFARKMVYCTSNTSDYCAPGLVPHPDIAEDCAEVGGMVFTNTLLWALNEVKTEATFEEPKG